MAASGRAVSTDCSDASTDGTRSCSPMMLQLGVQLEHAGMWRTIQSLCVDGCTSLKQLQLRLPCLRTLSMQGCSALQLVCPAPLLRPCAVSPDGASLPLCPAFQAPANVSTEPQWWPYARSNAVICASGSCAQQL